ncbi:MAG: hypothetical protein ACLQQB_01750 [Solirubrobacteraceae bacterium]|jgi:hypothetical protein
MPSHHRRGSLAIRVLTALIAILCALGLGACGNTLQDQPIPHNELEDLLLAPYPVYWLGGSFHGLQITEAARDPSGSFIVQYGDCLEGGQSVCVTPLKIITSPDNSFVPGEGPATSRRSASLRGTDGFIAERGDAISIPTGPVVVDIYAHTPELARAAAATAVPVNYPGAPGARLASPLPNTGFGERPLPSQVPNPLRSLG